MIRNLLKFAPWLCLLAIVFATVSPIGWRPHDLLPVDVDRALAFLLLGALFVLAYPRHFVLCAVLVVVGAGAIELLQLLSPSRHAHVEDAVIKAFGAVAGVLVGRLAARFFGLAQDDRAAQPAE